jgi:hypothetical protein
MQISEIMYDPVGKEPDGEWLELYNNDTSAVNLTGWKILESGYNRSLTLIDGTFALEPNNYIVVCRNATLFKADYPSYAKSLLQSTFSLNNSGESIQLLDASGAAVENVIYNSSLGANNNSKSLQLYNENWCEGNSTPGFANVCEDQEPPPKPQPVCGNGILEDGETSDTCCADAGCPQNKSCISNQCKFVADSENQNNTENETANETAPFLVSILELPAEAKQGENFTIRLELTNKFNETKTADIYSYAYSGSTLATEGGWTGNLQAINLTAGESTVVNLTNKIKVDAVVGIYSFKVRAVVDSKKYDKISAINIIVNSNPGNLSMPESSKFQASNITPSKSLNLTDDKSPAGAFVWSSGSTTIGIAFWLFTATLLVFVVVLLLMLLRKQNP